MLEICALSKKFRGGVQALEGVGFRVERGEIFGLLGHNGAGKSTTLGIMLGMVHADAGDVLVDGVSVIRERAKALAQVGAIFESPEFYDYLTGWQNLKMVAALSGYFDEEAFREAVELVGLTDRIDEAVRTYSHGMRQRLGLAQALLPEPKVLLLDEPTDGLDPEGIHEFRELVLRLREERGLTILLNSHLLSEVEQMCERFAILKKGKLVYEGSAAELQEGDRRFRVEVRPVDRAGEVVAGFGGTLGDGVLVLPREVDVAGVVARWVEVGVEVREVRSEVRGLEELYLEVTRG